MGAVLRVTVGEFLIIFIRCRSVAVQLTICEFLSKSLGGKSFSFLKIDNFTVKAFKVDQIFNGEIFKL